jgi:hypothetical protein
VAKMTVAELQQEILTHEAVCAERYQTFITRVDRLERILIVAAGAIIVGMGSILSAILIGGST